MPHGIRNILIAVFIGAGCCSMFALGAENAMVKKVEPYLSWHKFHDAPTYRILGMPSTAIESSTSLSWPDGRQSIVLYIKKGSCRYRCIEHFSKELKILSDDCYALKDFPSHCATDPWK